MFDVDQRIYYVSNGIIIQNHEGIPKVFYKDGVTTEQVKRAVEMSDMELVGEVVEQSGEFNIREVKEI